MKRWLIYLSLIILLLLAGLLPSCANDPIDWLYVNDITVSSNTSIHTLDGTTFGGGGGGGVTSFNARTGVVLPLVGDYSAFYEPKIVAGLITDYWRGDKSWQPFPAEVDPVWTASDAFGITALDRANWTTAYNGRVDTWNGPLHFGIGNIASITAAGAATDGYMSFADWNLLHGIATDFIPYVGATDNINLNAKYVTNGIFDSITANGTWTAVGTWKLPAMFFNGDITTDRWGNKDTNTFLGVHVLGAGTLAASATNGTYNTAVGYYALHDITTSYFNTAIGAHALGLLTSGIYNTAVGQLALGDVVTGNFNTAIGLQTLTKNTGSWNTAIGFFAGAENILGDSNIFIGSSAGKSELGSNKLYIDVVDTATPLIWGDFSTDNLTFNGTVNLATHQINNLLDPTLAQDAATKNYVDTHAMAFTSRAKAYLLNGSAEQVIPNAGNYPVMLDSEVFDGSGEFDSTKKIGTADATLANFLLDADGGFSSGDVNGWVWNTTDNTYARVTSFVDGGKVGIGANIMANGEGYKLFRSKFTATQSGYYMLVGNVSMSMVASKRMGLMFYVNNAVAHLTAYDASLTAYIYPNCSTILYLAAGDYVQMFVFNDTTTTQNLYYGSSYTFMAVHRMS